MCGAGTALRPVERQSLRMRLSEVGDDRGTLGKTPGGMRNNMQEHERLSRKGSRSSASSSDVARSSSCRHLKSLPFDLGEREQFTAHGSGGGEAIGGPLGQAAVNQIDQRAQGDRDAIGRAVWSGSPSPPSPG